MSGEVIRGRVAVLDSPGKPLRQATADVAVPGAGQVLVRIRACGVCRSDRIVQTSGEGVAPPVVLGHEAAGVVERVGDGVVGLASGDHVVLAWTPACGRCAFCLRGRPNLCAGLEIGPVDGRLSEGGRPLGRYMSVGGFAELTVVEASQAIKVRDDAPLERICLIGCGVMTGFGAALRSAAVRAGDAVVVFGCGAVGLSAVQAAVIAGADPVLAVERDAAKLDLAARLGATAVDAVAADPVPAIGEATGGGADVAIEAVGDPDVLRQAIACTRPGGTTVTVGLTELAAELRIPSVWLLLDRTLRGSIYGSANPALDFPMLVEWYMGGRLRLDELVTSTYPLERVNDALAALDAGGEVRGVIVIEE